jgi:hypothetical protein
MSRLIKKKRKASAATTAGVGSEMNIKLDPDRDHHQRTTTEETTSISHAEERTEYGGDEGEEAEGNSRA